MWCFEIIPSYLVDDDCLWTSKAAPVACLFQNTAFLHAPRIMLSPSALKTMDCTRKLSSLYHRSDYCDWKLTCLYWSCGSHEKLPNCDPLSSCHSRSFLTLAILTLPIQLIFTDFWLLKNLSTGRTSSHVFKNTFLDIKRPYKLGKTQRLMAELLARASGALRKFGKLSIREILVVTSPYFPP